MRVQYIFRIRGHLDVDRRWRYKRGDWTFQFHGAGEFASSLSVTVADVKKEHWPTVIQDPEPGVRAHIDIPDPYAWFVVADVKDIAGFLGLFRVYDIETETVKIDWIPDNEAEREALPITSFRKFFATPSRSPIGGLPPDVVARCILSAGGNKEIQVPLSFFRHGVEDAVNGKWVEAFYDFYFVLETMFANGKTNNIQVLKQYLASSELCDTLDELLSNQNDLHELEIVDSKKFTEIIEPQDKESIFRFVTVTRGLLHHHHMKQSQNKFKWDPREQNEYHFAATLVKLISFRICMKRMQVELWGDRVDLSKVRIWSKEEPKTQICFVYSESFGGVQRHEQQTIVEVAGNLNQHGMPSPKQLLKAEQEFRSAFDNSGRCLISYEAKPADGSRGRFSEYRAYVPHRG